MEESTVGANFLKQIAEKGNSKVQFRTGKLYLNGVGVPKDKEAAIQWLEKSANQDNAAAQCELGKLFSHSEQYKTYHKEKDASQAQKNKENAIAHQWFQKSVKQDYPEAFSGLLELELESLFGFDETEWSTCKNGKNMFDWASKGAESGNKYAIFYLGICYCLGIGTANDDDKGIEWLEKAAAAGNKYGAFYLASVYISEESAQVDYNKASQWYQKAKKLGYDSENDSLLQNILRHFEKQNDMDCFEDAAFPISYHFHDTNEIENELSTLFTPYINRVQSNDILLENGDENREVAYLPLSARDLYRALTEMQDLLIRLAEDMSIKPPQIYKFAIEDFFPYYKTENGKHIKKEIVQAWFFAKRYFPEQCENMPFLNDSEILDYAEVADNDSLTLFLISIVETKIEIESCAISNVDIYKDLTHLKENPNDTKTIKKIADLFMNGSSTVPRSYSIARKWYAKLPNDVEAKINLAKIDNILKNN
jgi:TPR repeat protein